MSGGVKYDNEKPRMDLIPPKPIVEVSKVFTMGAKKYEDRNWERGIAWGRVYSALQRHLFSWWSGEDKDPESGLSHLAHAGFGILALLEYLDTHPELDDRGNKTRDNVLPERAQETTPDTLSSEDVKSLFRRYSGRMVLGGGAGSVGRVQVDHSAVERQDPNRC